MGIRFTLKARIVMMSGSCASVCSSNAKLVGSRSGALLCLDDQPSMIRVDNAP